MRFDILDGAIARAAQGLSMFGIEVGAGGMKTVFVPAEEFSMQVRGGELTVRYQKRAQIFLALKTVSDEYRGGDFFLERTPAFSDLTS